MLIDLGKGQNRMGGSILGQTLDQSGDVVPDVDDPQDLVNLVNAVNALRAEGQILAYHDRSDGGLLAAAAEMAFAGHVGVALNVDMLVTEGDGISDSRMDTGDAKNWAGQVGARRDELTLEGVVQRRIGCAAAGAHRRAQRRDADAARTRPVQVQPLRGQDPPWSRPKSTLARANCRSGAMPRPCSARRWRTCTRCGTR